MSKLKGLAAVALLTLSPLTMAGEENKPENRVDESERVNVVWVNPKKFTDLKPANGRRDRFRNHTMEKLYKHLDKLAKRLPEGHKLKLNVTDIDLAGRVWPGHFVGFDTASDVRLVKSIEIPRMDFSYELINASGEVIKSGEKELKDMGFMNNISSVRKHDALRYEKHMLKRWFSREFKDVLVVDNKS